MYYHILTSVSPTDKRVPSFKIFIPTKIFGNMLPNLAQYRQLNGTVTLSRASEQEECNRKAQIEFPQINKILMVSHYFLKDI